MIDRLFTRDSMVWNLTLLASALMLASTMLTDWFTPDHARHLGQFAAFLGAFAAKLSTSPLPHSDSLNVGGCMSKLGTILESIGKIAPLVLAFTPLAPIAGPIAAAMQEAEAMHGPQSGAAKLAHVVGIAQDAAAAVNAQAGTIVVHPDLIPAATAQIVGAIISVANVAGKDPRFLGPPTPAPAPEFIGPPEQAPGPAPEFLGPPQRQ